MSEDRVPSSGGGLGGPTNTSGEGPSAVLPAGVKGWNWGAFWLTWIWGIAHKVWISLLAFVPGVNLVMPFVLGAKGSEWAWRNRRFEKGPSQFQAVQKRWAIWGWVGFFAAAILAVLLVVGALRAAATQASAAKRSSALRDMATIETGLDLYAADNGEYPTTQQGLQALLTKPSTPPVPRNWNGPYLRSLPPDPWGNAYVYEFPSARGQYEFELSSRGERGQPIPLEELY